MGKKLTPKEIPIHTSVKIKSTLSSSNLFSTLNESPQ